MLSRLLSRVSSGDRVWIACAWMMALVAGCNATKPLAGQVSVVADLQHRDGWCSEGAPLVFQGLELRALGGRAVWSISGRDILAGRGQRALPAGLYVVSVPWAAEALSEHPGAALMLLDAPLVSVLASQVTTINVRGAAPPCSLSLRP